jgi:hypothetical protein
MSFVDWRSEARNSGLLRVWHGLCEVMVKPVSKVLTMFNTLLNKTSKLDRAVILSVAAMLSFNIVILTSQLQAAPQVAQVQGNPAQQA